MGYDNYLYQSSYKLVKTAADAIADRQRRYIRSVWQ